MKKETSKISIEFDEKEKTIDIEVGSKNCSRIMIATALEVIIKTMKKSVADKTMEMHEDKYGKLKDKERLIAELVFSDERDKLYHEAIQIEGKKYKNIIFKYINKLS